MFLLITIYSYCTSLAKGNASNDLIGAFVLTLEGFMKFVSYYVDLVFIS